MSVKLVGKDKHCENDRNRCAHEKTHTCFTCGIYNGKAMESKFAQV